MSSNVEQGPNAGLLARAKEAAKNPFLVELGKRVLNPRQAPIIGEALGLTIEERKNTRTIAWLKKYQPATLQVILSEASEAENKKPKGGKMRAVFLRLKGRKVEIEAVDHKGMNAIIGTVSRVGKEYVQLSAGKDCEVFVGYSQIIKVIAQK